MCGIAGIISLKPEGNLAARLERMVNVQSHRGPDDQGFWIYQKNHYSIGLGHSRLAVIDLTTSAHQPMFSACKRYVLTYNGELYNYLELRKELAGKGVEFRTNSDTEVLLQALIHWGESALNRFNGMWAFSFLDTQSNTLLFARDRFGVKPLYYHKDERAFYFASEIKAILNGTDKKFPVNTAAVERFIHQSVLNGQPQTFFDGIKEFPPGHYMRLNLDDFASSSSRGATIVNYWRAESDNGFHDNGFHADSLKKISESIRDTFFDAVRIRLRSDKPVGVLLSGGLDSSSIAVAMREILGKDVDLHMLSAVNDVPKFDEQPFIDQISSHLQTPIHKVWLRFSPEEMMRLLEEVTWFNDEPVGSFSVVAHYLLMQKAKELGVTVLLSGQGSDELLCGYRKYLGFYVQTLLRQGRWTKAIQLLISFFNNKTLLAQFDLKEAKRYLPWVPRTRDHDVRGPALKETSSLLNLGLNGGSLLKRQIEDLYCFSIPAIVHMEDRMSMSAAREIRLPFLDYRLVETLLKVPSQLKLREGWTKWILRKVMEPYLPATITWRKDKQGFVNPESEWIRTDLNKQVREILQAPMIAADLKLIDQNTLNKLYAAYCQQGNRRNLIGYQDIFNPLSLEVWLRRFESYIKYP